MSANGRPDDPYDREPTRPVSDHGARLIRRDADGWEWYGSFLPFDPDRDGDRARAIEVLERAIAHRVKKHRYAVVERFTQQRLGKTIVGFHLRRPLNGAHQ